MKLWKLLSLLLLSTFSYAHYINFRVICVKCTQVSVKVDGNNVPLTQYSNLPYFMAPVDINTNTKYHYIADGNEEPFERDVTNILNDRTYNDFFGRQETIKYLYQFGFPTNKKWERTIGKQELFDDSYIPTIYIDGDISFFKNAPENTFYFDRVTFFLKDNVYYFTKVPVACKNRNWNKFQLRFGLPNDEHNRNPLKRPLLKLRASAEDPAFMRQLIYSDILHAIGNPTHESVSCRVYCNGEPIGLYVLQEDVGTTSFVRSAFYGKPKSGKIKIDSKDIGTPLDCSTGADFKPGGSLNPFQLPDSERVKGKNEPPIFNKDKVEPLRQAMDAVDVNDASSIKEFSEKWFDLDVFFKAVAMEYLAGHWDSYWYYTTNFAIYDDPKESTSDTFKFYFIDQDFDQTWGVGLSSSINRFGNEYTSKSYKEDVNRSWSISSGGDDGPNRFAIDKFLSGGLTQGMFEAYLVSIVKHIFNPVAMGEKVKAYHDRLRPELEWDYNSPKLYKSKDQTVFFTIEDFDSGINTGGKVSHWGILDWTEQRANAVAQEFGFEYDSVALTPKAAEKISVKDVEPMKAGGAYDEYAGPKVTSISPEDQILSSNAYNINYFTKSIIITIIYTFVHYYNLI